MNIFTPHKPLTKLYTRNKESLFYDKYSPYKFETQITVIK